MIVRGKQTYKSAKNVQELELDGFPLASFSRRAIAIALDFLIAAVLFNLLVIPLTMLLANLGLIKIEGMLLFEFTFFKNWYSVVALVVYFTLSIYWGKGKTPGKKICRIRVVSLTHGHINLWHALERALGYGASALELGFGFAQYFIRADRRTVHDRIAETIVISETPKRRKK